VQLLALAIARTTLRGSFCFFVLRYFAMTIQRFASSLALFVVFTAFFTYMGGKAVEEAARIQCRTHDWPVEQNQEHLEFCQIYGYPTN
jgi:hypothetical protein